MDRPRVVSLSQTVMSLYHNLITGSTDFPLIHFDGPISVRQDFAPFVQVENRENVRHPLMSRPPGLMVPRRGYTSRTILTPTLPERVELRVLGNSWSRVHTLMVDGGMIRRVISTVHDCDLSVIPNRWRVTDYTENGQCLMSVLCRFTNVFTWSTERPKKRSRSHEEEGEDEDGESSSQSQPKKRLRV